MTISIPHHHVAKPTEAQKEVGNYRKAHVRVHSLDVTIENPKGSERSGKDADGKEWRVKMPAHYGYFKKSVGADGDHVDCYIGTNPKSDRVYIVNQIDAKTKKFDEHKCMLGYSSRNDALKDYIKAFSDGKGRDRMGGVVEMPVETFKTWVKSHNTKAPARNAYAEGGAVSDPLTIRQNNPGALEYAPWMARYGATVGDGGRYAQFQNPDDGYRVMGKVLDTYGSKYGLNTIRGIINRWAPSNVDNNSTSAYISSVAKKLDIDPDAPISEQQRPALMQAMAGYEAGRAPAPLSSAPAMQQTSTPLTSVRGGPDLSWTKPYSDPDTEKTASPLASLLQKYTQPSTTPIDFDGNVRWGDGSVQGLFNPANMR